MAIEKSEKQQDLETEKLRLEIQKLNREALPWNFHLTTKGTILIGSTTLLLAFMSGIFDAKKAELSAQKSELVATIERFKTESLLAQEHNSRIREQTEKLEAERVRLTKQNERYVQTEKIMHSLARGGNLKLTYELYENRFSFEIRKNVSSLMLSTENPGRRFDPIEGLELLLADIVALQLPAPIRMLQIYNTDFDSNCPGILKGSSIESLILGNTKTSDSSLAKLSTLPKLSELALSHQPPLYIFVHDVLSRDI